MTRLGLTVVFAVFAWSVFPATQSPFKLPLSAKTTSATLAEGGWKTSGEIGVSFEQAKAQLAVKLTAAGWTHLHTIALGKDREVEAWARGDEELTLMTWRIAAGKAGFSYGVTKRTDSQRERATEGGCRSGR